MHLRTLLVGVVALAACRGPSSVAESPAASGALSASASSNAHDHVAPASSDPMPGQELEKARKATARYQDVRNAVADGYEDIDVVLRKNDPPAHRWFSRRQFLKPENLFNRE